MKGAMLQVLPMIPGGERVDPTLTAYNSDHGESEGGKCRCDGNDGKDEEGEGEEGPQEGGSTGE